VWPDLTILLDMNSGEGLARAERRGAGEDRFEAKGTLFHERVREGFVQRAEDEPDRIVIIDASRSEQAIADEISEHVSRLFAARGIS
jgi:dTMP kinase